MLSIIIPAHNEALRIGDTLAEYCRYFSSKYNSHFEIIVVTNHCRDNTNEIVEKYAVKYPQVMLCNITGQGKGKAIRAGFSAASGELMAITDADGATSPEELDKLIEHIESLDGVIASRWLPQSVTLPKQAFIRRFVSRGWNLLARIIFGLDYKDTQCGAKVFTRTAIDTIKDCLRIDGFACDLELLYMMKQTNRHIKEIPIVWNNHRGSSVKLIRCVPAMMLELIDIKKHKMPIESTRK